MAGDALFQNVVLLLGGEGVANSTNIVDSSQGPKAVTVFGDTKFSAAQPRFTGTSMAFDGAGDYLSVANHPDFDLTSGDFTIELWAYITSYSGGTQTLLNKDGRLNVSYPQYLVGVGPAGQFVAALGSGAGTSSVQSFSGSGTIPLNTWVHVVLQRQGTTITGYLGGAQQFSQAQTATMSDGGRPLLVGYQQDQPTDQFVRGYLYGVRLTKGVARYTSAFTPPAGPFLPYAGQLSGTVRDDTGAGASRIVRAYRRDTGVLAGMAVSASDGTYVINCPTTAVHTLVFLDDDAGTQYNALVLDRVIPV